MTISFSHLADTTNLAGDEKELATIGYEVLKAYLQQERSHYTFHLESEPPEAELVTISAAAMGLLI